MMEWFADFTRVTFAGIEKTFDVSSVFCEFTVGGHFVQIKWYGIIIALGFTLAALFGGRIAYTWRMNLSKMVDVLIYGTFAGIIGARAYYVAFAPFKYESFIDMINIRDGGLAIYGGVIGGFLGVLAVCKWKKYNFFGVLDCICPGVMIGQLIGRWGNFMNAEAYGVIDKYDFLGIPFS